MSALDIIALPGQPGMFARRVAVQAWQSAGSPPVNSAGRLYAEQKRLWDGWRQRLPGFNPADNPDDESEALAHVRFVAFDIDPTAERIRRLNAAGLHRPYTYEPWHWELPNVHGYALVRAIPATASLEPTPIEQEEDDEMSAEQVKEIIDRIDKQTSTTINMLMEHMDGDRKAIIARLDEQTGTAINMLMTHMDGDRQAVLDAVTASHK